jgi:proteic killer suppression protein
MKIGTIAWPWRYVPHAVARDCWRGDDSVAKERYACCSTTRSASRKLIVDKRQLIAYLIHGMIRSFKSKPLAELWEKGRTSKIDAKIHERVLRRLDRLDATATPQEMNIPGFDFHALRGFKPTRYSVHVNGPWCITFEFEDGDACRVDFEQYH